MQTAEYVRIYLHASKVAIVCSSDPAMVMRSETHITECSCGTYGLTVVQLRHIRINSLLSYTENITEFAIHSFILLLHPHLLLLPLLLRLFLPLLLLLLLLHLLLPLLLSLLPPPLLLPFLLLPLLLLLPFLLLPLLIPLPLLLPPPLLLLRWYYSPIRTFAPLRPIHT